MENAIRIVPGLVIVGLILLNLHFYTGLKEVKKIVTNLLGEETWKDVVLLAKERAKETD